MGPTGPTGTTGATGVIGPTGPIGPDYVFIAANNVTFGTNGSSVTASASFPAAIPFALAAGTQTAASGTVLLADSNSISFGMLGNSQITASIAFPAQSSLVFVSSNGVSFGTNGSTVTARVASVLATGAENFIVQGASNGTISATSAIALSASSMTFVAAQNIQMTANGSLNLFGNNNAQFQGGANVFVQAALAISISATGGVRILNTGAGSVIIGGSGNSVGFFNSAGVTKQTLTGTNATAINNLFAILGSHGLISNNATVSAFATGNLGAIAAGTQTATSGTVGFVNSNSISFGMAGSSQITASIAFPAQSSFLLASSNGISFGTNGSTVTARAASLSGTANESVQILGSGVPIRISNANGNVNITAGGLGDIILEAGPGGAYLRGDRNEIGAATNRTVAFYGAAGATRQTVTGTDATAFNNLMAALNNVGIISNAATMSAFPTAGVAISAIDNGVVPFTSGQLPFASAQVFRLQLQGGLSATQFDLFASQVTTNMCTLSVSFGVYGINGQTASLISSASGTISFSISPLFGSVGFTFPQIHVPAGDIMVALATSSGGAGGVFLVGQTQMAPLGVNVNTTNYLTSGSINPMNTTQSFAASQVNMQGAFGSSVFIPRFAILGV